MKSLPSHVLLRMGILFLFLTACKDDNEVVTPAQKLIGIWNLQSSNVEFAINGQGYVSFIQQIPGLSNTEKAIAIVYVQSLIQDLEIAQGSTFEFKADNIYEIIPPGDTPETGTWMLSEDGSLLTLSVEALQDFDLQELVFEVQTLTDTSLILTTTSEIKYDFDEDGGEDTLAAEIMLTLSK